MCERETNLRKKHRVYDGLCFYQTKLQKSRFVYCPIVHFFVCLPISRGMNRTTVNEGNSPRFHYLNCVYECTATAVVPPSIPFSSLFFLNKKYIIALNAFILCTFCGIFVSTFNSCIDLHIHLWFIFFSFR